MSELAITDYEEQRHSDVLREFVVGLQDYEHRLYSRLPPGADIVDAYVPHMLGLCRACEGKVLIAELDSEVVGYATILTKVQSDEIADGDMEYGQISDLMVRREFRGRGIGKELVAACETYAREHGVERLRIGVLAANETADRLYDSLGFDKLYVEREKKLTAKD